jgi:hypothetical protein
MRKQTEGEVEIHHISLPSPTDLAKSKALMKTLKQTRAKYGDDVKPTFHISPSTAAMGAVWIIVAKTRLPAELIESWKEGGVRGISLPFNISAEFIPDFLRHPAVIALRLLFIINSK